MEKFLKNNKFRVTGSQKTFLYMKDINSPKPYNYIPFERPKVAFKI